MPEINPQIKILAQAIFEIRILLSGYLGSDNDGDLDVREAAHLAWALHNQALAVLEEKAFDVNEAMSNIQAVDKMFDEDFSRRFFQVLSDQKP